MNGSRQNQKNTIRSCSSFSILYMYMICIHFELQIMYIYTQAIIQAIILQFMRERVID